jgi:uncharacterized membrane protein
MKQQDVARALGWFSLGLGVAELVAPRQVEKAIGIKRKHEGLTRSFGLREMTAGIGLLSEKKTSAWMWSRVAGDILDLACLGTAYSSDRNNKKKLTLATAAVLGVTVADIFCSVQLTKEEAATTRSLRRSIIIRRSPEELYHFWRNFENLPRIMSHLEIVRSRPDGKSHWVATGPAGSRVEWEAEIVDDQPGHLIAWQSLPDSQVENWGTVRFEPTFNSRETVVNVEISYNPPAGALGAAVAKLFGEAPEQQIKDDLRRFKQLIETGEVATTRGQPAGRSKSETKHEKYTRKLANA